MRLFDKSVWTQGVRAAMVMLALVPTVSYFTATQATAQGFDGPIASLEQWAVVEFTQASNVPAGLGKSAAEAFITQLQTGGRVDPFSMESVENKMRQMGILAPVQRQSDLMRLAQDLRVANIVSGEIKNARVVTVNGGKRADVIARIVVWNTASGQPEKGAALAASSGVRPAETEDATLLNEAASNLAFQALQTINSQQLPTGTVLNTLERKALINQGARTGFRQGQEVIVIRGREQVASGVVSTVEPDKAFIEIKRESKGVQPGDKIRAVFAVPDIDVKFRTDGTASIRNNRRGGNNSGVVSALLIIGALVLIGSGSGGNNNANNLTAEPTLVAGSPRPQLAVNLAWRVDGFVKGADNRMQFQIWRDDVADAPVLVVPGNQTRATDRGVGNPTGSAAGNGELPPVGSRDCAVSDLPGGTPVVPVGLIPARPYTYSVELIYRVNSLDVPSDGTGGGTTGGGTTGGVSTGGGTTGGTTGGVSGGRTGSFEQEYALAFGGRQLTAGTTGTTGTTTGTTGTTTGTTTGSTTGGGSVYCYFRSARVAARGIATPFDATVPRSPQNDSLVSVAPVFRFDSARGSSQGVLIEYALQFSTDPTFPTDPRRTKVVFRFTDTVGTGTLSTPQAITAAITEFPGTEFIYWRVGARNPSDVPGPALTGGERYVFGTVLRFRRPTLPPAP